MPATVNAAPGRRSATAYHFPDFHRETLPNGLTVWTVPVASAAVVNVGLLVDAGAAAEDEAQGGVAALTAQLLVTGTRRLDAGAFAEATERLGIEVSSESSWDSARRIPVAAEHADDGIALLAEMVREPRLDEGEFERLRRSASPTSCRPAPTRARWPTRCSCATCLMHRRRTGVCRRARPRPSKR